MKINAESPAFDSLLIFKVLICTRFLDAQGLAVKRGTVIDTRIVEVPAQRNTRSENAASKEACCPPTGRTSRP